MSFGHLRWVKIVGCSEEKKTAYWPTRIADQLELVEETITRLGREDLSLVYFFGSHNFCWVDLNNPDVVPNDLDVTDYCASLTPESKSPLFQSALDEAFAWQKQLCTPRRASRRRATTPALSPKLLQAAQAQKKRLIAFMERQFNQLPERDAHVGGRKTSIRSTRARRGKKPANKVSTISNSVVDCLSSNNATASHRSFASSSSSDDTPSCTHTPKSPSSSPSSPGSTLPPPISSPKPKRGRPRKYDKDGSLLASSSKSLAVPCPSCSHSTLPSPISEIPFTAIPYSTKIASPQDDDSDSSLGFYIHRMLEAHLVALKEGKRIYHCMYPSCTSSFFAYFELRDHVESHHLSKLRSYAAREIYKCPYGDCDVQFSGENGSEEWRNHIEAEHLCIKRRSCVSCSSPFISPTSNLQRHPQSDDSSSSGIKRSRGRPRKHPASPPSPIDPSLRRGRGRPRKYQRLDKEGDKIASPRDKKGPGRPRKHPRPDLLKDKKSDPPERRRGPGRPPKKAAGFEEEGVSAESEHTDSMLTVSNPSPPTPSSSPISSPLFGTGMAARERRPNAGRKRNGGFQTLSSLDMFSPDSDISTKSKKRPAPRRSKGIAGPASKRRKGNGSTKHAAMRRKRVVKKRKKKANLDEDYVPPGQSDENARPNNRSNHYNFPILARDVPAFHQPPPREEDHQQKFLDLVDLCTSELKTNTSKPHNSKGKMSASNATCKGVENSPFDPLQPSPFAISSGNGYHQSARTIWR